MCVCVCFFGGGDGIGYIGDRRGYGVFLLTWVYMYEKYTNGKYMEESPMDIWGSNWLIISHIDICILKIISNPIIILKLSRNIVCF